MGLLALLGSGWPIQPEVSKAARWYRPVIGRCNAATVAIDDRKPEGWRDEHCAEGAGNP